MAMAESLERKPRGAESPARSIRCSRCNGLMVVEVGFDSLLGVSETAGSLRRCVQCGEVIDPVILQNRQLQFGTDGGRTCEGRLL